MHATLIYDRDHGTANEGWYLRVRDDEGMEQDIVLDAETEAEALTECRCYVDGSVDLDVHR